MNLQLENKVALVTGGAAGIGAACVRELVAEGARAAIVDRDRARGSALADELSRAGGTVAFFEAELTDEAACRDASASALRTFGKLDILINCAGVNDAVSLDEPPAAFLASLQRNLLHVFTLTHFMREALVAARGSIVNVSSKVAVTGQGRTSGYAAAKGGILALTREWALALAPQGVRVNCVVPAECDTPQYQSWFNSRPDPAAAREAVEQLVPLGGRLTTPEEIAATIVFLASPRASHTTGQIIFVDGGYTHLDRAATHPHPKWD